MLLKTAGDAREFAKNLTPLIRNQDFLKAGENLSAVLNQRTPFRLLDIIGWELGLLDESLLHIILNQIANMDKEGGWVIIAAALHEQLSVSLCPILEKAQSFIIQADVWYACDTFGERVVGQAIWKRFNSALKCLDNWRYHQNKWVRRSIGVGVHFWAKRTKSNAGEKDNRLRLLEFLSPMMSDEDNHTARGVGWGLKTLGRYNPVLVHDFLISQVIIKKRDIPSVVVRKALKFLPSDLKNNFLQKNINL